MQAVMNLAGHVWVLAQGERIAEGAPSDITRHERVIEAYHDPNPFAMVRIVVAPCSPFSVTKELMRKSLELARHYSVRCHTHLAETVDEQRFCLERFGLRPVGYAAELGWMGMFKAEGVRRDT